MKKRGPKVLIADCHEDVLITFERLLEDNGFDTTTAWTGRDALAATRDTIFDLALVNEYLSDMDAEDFLSELRHRGVTVPCIVMQPSATRITNTSRFVAAGAVAVVCKWSHANVLEAVRAQLAPAGLRPQFRASA